MRTIFTTIIEQYCTTAKMKNLHNQTPLDEQSLDGNQQYDFIRHFYEKSIGPAAFFVFSKSIFRPLILSKIIITYLESLFIESQAKQENFKNLYTFFQTLLKENMKVAPNKSLFFSLV